MGKNLGTKKRVYYDLVDVANSLDVDPPKWATSKHREFVELMAPGLKKLASARGLALRKITIEVLVKL